MSAELGASHFDFLNYKVIETGRVNVSGTYHDKRFLVSMDINPHKRTLGSFQLLEGYRVEDFSAGSYEKFEEFIRAYALREAFGELAS
ncbi:MAG: hypothetical protein A2418_01045 [Candidatus Brennerbacteria bacterium RIFOXYC1_FULL_41_11]|uniref:Uncharacterized protein n=1 Tax=Candidatus Brennerbacteria bacterium RIFOXYD1_FULL_41_16 TaxID=1797529 RepID=A0A1G1XLX2_9BACT|nr:MAG: hypothetical protein UU61_C0014G0013 [Parcubacteria group bacterium GW2011_GWB1_41_4]OGY39396.1 MAG: hypothetical protein A2391_02915 [Candidatus Brennerbacteria bacterium RIFOXYB1_FULL_41_13]OGY40030.1 MAG: hypothetical protein A2418_01045 [Candidatus Brennerbacteria bacterium RIFOXYC1_FULL_41_11]OGY40962.1 MAG: hypothetical protein A2570_00515 [Candidatus Brennerbacteria bacterium RIFOXYD1_FULL_41_16]